MRSRRKTLYRSRKTVLITIAALVAVIVLLSLATYLAGPRYLSKAIRKAATEMCETCDVRWGNLGLTLFPLRIRISDVKLHWGEPTTTQIDSSIGSIQADINLMPLFSKRLEIENIMVATPKVTVIEGDKKTPHSSGSSTGAGAPAKIGEIKLADADFVYQRLHLGKGGKRTGQVHVGRIHGRVTPQGKSVRADVTAILERSGSLNLAILIPDREHPEQVDISLLLNSFELSESNAYFAESEGVRIAGKLDRGEGSVALREHQLSAVVRARYHGLELDFKKMEDRSALSATLSSAVGRYKTLKDKPDQGGPHPHETVKLGRKAEETLLSFIFRGLKEAALLETRK